MISNPSSCNLKKADLIPSSAAGSVSTALPATALTTASTDTDLTTIEPKVLRAVTHNASHLFRHFKERGVSSEVDRPDLIGLDFAVFADETHDRTCIDLVNLSDIDGKALGIISLRTAVSLGVIRTLPVRLALTLGFGLYIDVPRMAVVFKEVIKFNRDKPLDDILLI